MDRTIKFRGKSIYDEDWLYGSLVKIEKDRYAVIPSLNDIEIGKSISMYEVCLETIGQFTGLYDKNGKEIYEGDIVERITPKNLNFGFIGNVVFDKNIALFCVEHNKFGPNSRTPFVMPDDWMDEYSNKLKCEFEIKGNIYDHPELIKEE